MWTHHVIAVAALLDSASAHAAPHLFAALARPTFHARLPVSMVSEIPMASASGEAAMLEEALELDIAETPDGVICARGA